MWLITMLPCHFNSILVLIIWNRNGVLQNFSCSVLSCGTYYLVTYPVDARGSFWVCSFRFWLKILIVYNFKELKSVPWCSAVCGYVATKERCNWMWEDDKSQDRPLNNLSPFLLKWWLRSWLHFYFDFVHTRHDSTL